MAQLYNPSCERARESLFECEKEPRSQHLPQGSVPYFPRSNIVNILRDFPIAEIFTCSCDRCRHHADLPNGVDERRRLLDEKELLGPYATIYALLILLRYPGLIYLFLQHRINLDASYINDANLSFLCRTRVLSTRQAEIIKKEILEAQYRFRVQMVLKRQTISILAQKEILPIIEDSTPVGSGDFGEVYAFDFPEEYIHENLRDKQITRFARKIFFKRERQTKNIKEWVNLLHVNNLEHENLMEAFAAIEHGDIFFIVFELAQCTLWTFLEGTSTVTYTSQDLWEQVHGLASGLAYLHGEKILGGRQTDERMFHMDLKPSNILIVRMVMKIADFGLSEYRVGPPTSESILFGDSKHEGAQVYAPPSRPGPPSDKIDIYSLGAIISEVACYDIGGADEVAHYRNKRKRDGLPDSVDDQDLSICFYSSTSFALKESVVNQHRTLLDATNPTGDTELLGAGLDRWQKTFYVQGLFQFIEKMLHVSESERPGAVEVKEDLGLRLRQVSRTIRGSEIDIWEATENGTRLLKTKPPVSAVDRLRAFVEQDKCGLWLYPNAQEHYVEINQLRLDGGIHQKVTEVFLKKRIPYKSIEPSYVATESVDKFTLRLIYAKGEHSTTYDFPTLRECLRFQSVMTGVNVYESKSIKLTSFAFFKKNKFMRSRSDTHTPKHSATQPMHLQIWASPEIEHEGMASRSTSAPAEIKLAIISESQIYLIKVSYEFKFPADQILLEDKRSNIMRLTSSEVSTLSIPKGIPLNLSFRPSPRYRNTDDTRFEESKYDEIRLTVKNEGDIDSFWTNLRVAHGAVPRPTTSSYIPPIQIA